MPRKRQPTLSGQPSQPISPVPGQTYGMGEQQMAMQRTMPAPQQATVPRPAAPQPQQAPQAAQQAADPNQMMAAAAQLRDQTGLLQQPTQRPNEPVTAGLSRGPGAGPEALQVHQGTPAGDLLRLLSRETGQSYFAELADRART